MITISKPLSASQAQTYHKSEFTSLEQSYYTQRDQVGGEWQGKLAARWGLTGEVTEEHFARLAHGQHPGTAEQLVRERLRSRPIARATPRLRSVPRRLWLGIAGLQRSTATKPTELWPKHASERNARRFIEMTGPFLRGTLRSQ